MNRQNPLFSSFGWITTTILLVGLGLTLWRTGGLAFSPGPLSSQVSTSRSLNGFDHHAAFEQECARCHQPFKRIQSLLCLDCHTNIQQQIATRTHTHANLPDPNNCRVCHPDHRGRDFDMSAEARRLYDHNQAAFNLLWHQLNFQLQPLQCADCHVFEGELSTPTVKCIDCHNAANGTFMVQHNAAFGDNCLACHDGLDRLASFDHQRSDFPLDGKHVNLECAACHAQDLPLYAMLLPGAVDVTDPSCQDCHREPTQHFGLFSPVCQDCHTTQGWHPAKWQDAWFDHAEDAAFSLERHSIDDTGQPLLCTGCHTAGFTQFDLQACVSCHSKGAEEAQFMAEHQLSFGTDCLACHDGVDRMSNFDHARLFPLTGRHFEIECTACHTDRVFQGTPAACFECHQEPAVHAGIFGLNCDSCHSTQAWTPAQLQSHTFPLDHGKQGLIQCQTCHTLTYTNYTCYGCHEHEPARIQAKHIEEGISSVELPDCAHCHPSGREEED